METSRPVVVKRMPENVNQRESRKFLQDVQPFLTADRPQLVFDLSLVKQLDAAGVEMLLHCVSEVMKRDGDLKLCNDLQLSQLQHQIFRGARSGRPGPTGAGQSAAAPARSGCRTSRP